MTEQNYVPEFSGRYIGKDGAMTCEEVCRILSDLVKTPSVTGDEKACGDYLAALAKENGLAVQIMPCYEEGRFNVIMSYGCEDYETADYGLMLHGHYDTVPVFDMADPYNTSVVDGKYMKGRGIVDQKSGLAASICAAIALKRKGISLKKPLCVACVIDEESEHSGSYALAKSGIKADYAFSTEPTGGKCGFGCKGTTPFRITVEGKTAHAGMPQNGINAIEKALPLLKKLFAASFASIDLGELGRYEGTLCVSEMFAGTAYNNVPCDAVIWMDRRTVPGEDTAIAKAQIQSMIDEVKAEDPTFKAKLEVARPDWKWQPIIERGLNPTLTDLDTPLYTALDESVRSLGLPEVEKEFWTGYTDMDFLVNDLGIPTLVYGPGDKSLCHSVDEIVEIDEVCRAAEIFCLTAEKICGV